MRLPFSLFLGLRYLRPRRTLFSAVTVLSLLGVLLGVMVLVVVISVMTGFDDMWREKILGFNAHITMTPVSGGSFDADPAFLDDLKSTPGIEGASPFIYGLAFLSHEGRVGSPIMRGVREADERSVSAVPDRMEYGAFDLQDGGIVLGTELARRLGASVGDTVLAYSPQSFLSQDELRLPTELEVRGIFRVGMFDLDAGYALVSLATARSLFGVERGVQGIQLKAADPSAPAVEALARKLDALHGPGLQAQTWMDQNRQLFSALQVEKNMMYFLLVFIVIVAAFGITNTLITVTVQKTREIGLLKALGYRGPAIAGVFLWQGWVAGTLGSGLGIAAGLGVLEYRNDLLRFLNERMGVGLLPPELYQLAEIPSRTLPGDLVIIAGVALLICTLAGLIPAWRAARLDPASALRYE